VRSIPPCSVNTSRALVAPVSVTGMDKNYGYYRLYPTFLSARVPSMASRGDTHPIDLDSSLGTSNSKCLILRMLVALTGIEPGFAAFS
jgi:hypothetical protein